MLTVMLATRNRSFRLHKTLAAFLRLQSPEGGWKVIVVDNGSQDNTKDIVKQFFNQLPLQYIFEPQIGKNFALNRGLNFIEGDLLVFTDDDVLPCKNWLVGYHRLSMRLKDFSIFSGPIVAAWDKEPSSRHLVGVPLNMMFAISDPNLSDGEVAHHLVWGPNMAIRSSIFQQGYQFNVSLGPSGESYPMGGESELIRRLDQAGFRCWYSNGVVVGHQISSEQLRVNWLLNRAKNFGRGRAHVEQAPSWTIFGFSWVLFKQLVVDFFSALFTVVSGDRKKILSHVIRFYVTLGRILEFKDLQQGVRKFK